MEALAQVEGKEPHRGCERAVCGMTPLTQSEYPQRQEHADRAHGHAVHPDLLAAQLVLGKLRPGHGVALLAVAEGDAPALAAPVRALVYSQHRAAAPAHTTGLCRQSLLLFFILYSIT